MNLREKKTQKVTQINVLLFLDYEFLGLFERLIFWSL